MSSKFTTFEQMMKAARSVVRDTEMPKPKVKADLRDPAEVRRETERDESIHRVALDEISGSRSRER